MEDDMAVMFPNRIRTLIVDDDAKFLKSASRLLSILDFDGTCILVLSRLAMFQLAANRFCTRFASVAYMPL